LINKLIIILFFIPILVNGQRVVYQSNNHVTAGESFQAVYYANDSYTACLLLIQTSLGMHRLKGANENCHFIFNLPKPLMSLAGDITLVLLDTQKHILRKDILSIRPNTNVQPEIEAYCGPKQILTGGEDYTEIIGTVLDPADNPWPENTSVEVIYSHMGENRINSIKSNPVYAYHRFYSGNQAGHPLIAISSNGAYHHEFELTQYPNAPTGFHLEVDRNHDVADGKHINKISTSIITDQYGNRMANGTMVSFRIIDTQGLLGFAQAPTMEGIATIHLPAPERASRWTIEPEIEQYVKGVPLEISFSPFARSFPVVFDNNVVIIGPVTGDKGQFISHNTKITIQISESGQLVDQREAFTDYGMAEIDLRSLNLEPCTYQLVLECGGQSEHLEIEVKP